MAWLSLRAPGRGAALTCCGPALLALALLSACVPPEGKPQPPFVGAPPPGPVAQGPNAAVQPPPPGNPAPQAATGPSPEDAATAGRTKVALLVPLTGANKSVGQAMLDAGNMALFEVSSDLALLPRDTGNSPEDARAAANNAVTNGAGLILGPVFAASVPPVREVGDPAGINVIAYSTDASVAGGAVFVMGFLPAQQVDRVVGYAKSRGLGKLAALVPDNPYGVAVSTEIGIMRDKLGMAAPRILKLDKDPKAELDSLTSDPPDMLLIALGGDQLRALGPILVDYLQQHPTQLLGTGLWDDPTLGQIPALVGGWYPAPVPDAFAAFEARFQQTYNYKPPRIATLAYDSVALAAAITKGAPGNPKPFSRDVLTQANGFLGIDGPFRFLPSGLVERNLAILVVGANGPQVADPPLANFEKLGE